MTLKLKHSPFWLFFKASFTGSWFWRVRRKCTSGWGRPWKACPPLPSLHGFSEAVPCEHGAMGQALAHDTDMLIANHTVTLVVSSCVERRNSPLLSHLRLDFVLPAAPSIMHIAGTQAVLSGAMLMVTIGKENHSRDSALKSGFLQLRCSLKGHQFNTNSRLPQIFIPPFPALPSLLSLLCSARETAPIFCFFSSEQF